MLSGRKLIDLHGGRLGIAIAFFAGIVAGLSACGAKPTVASTSPAAPSTAAIVAPVASPDPRLIYELRARCGNDAQAWFHHYWEEDHTVVKDFKIIGQSFASHYSERLNGCFAVVTVTSESRDSKTGRVNLGEDTELMNVLENKELGSYYKFGNMAQPMSCDVGGNSCLSRQAFDELTAPYMTN